MRKIREMSGVKLGTITELKAMDILRSMNFKNILHLAIIERKSRFDISCSKENKKYLVEVKHLNKKRNCITPVNFHLDIMKSKKEIVLVILIRDDGYSLLKLNKKSGRFNLINHSDKNFPYISEITNMKEIYHGVCINCKRRYGLKIYQNYHLIQCLVCGKFYDPYHKKIFNKKPNFKEVMGAEK